MNMTDKQIVEQLLAPDIYDPYMRPEGLSHTQTLSLID